MYRPLTAIASALALLAPLDANEVSVRVTSDLVDLFGRSTVSATTAHSATLHETCGGLQIPGVFLHPTARSEDAVARFDGVEIPRRRGGLELLLLFRVGLRDGIPWDSERHRPNGVRFAVRIDAETIYSEEVSGPGWRLRAVPLDRWAGREVSLSLCTNAIGGNSSYDWSVFGEPSIVEFQGSDELASLPRTAEGVGLVEIECREPSTVTVAFGDTRETRALTKGVHRVPCEFRSPATPTLSVESGDAALLGFHVARHAATLRIEELALGSPLVLTGDEPSALVRVRNVGKGAFDDSVQEKTHELRTHTRLHGSVGAVERTSAVRLGRIEPGEGKVLPLPVGVTARGGERRLELHGHELRYHVFTTRPPADPSRPIEGETSCAVDAVDGGGTVATLAGRWCRVRVIREASGDAYGLCEQWDGDWRRSASLYPLMRLVLARNGMGREEPRGRIDSMRAIDAATLHIDAGLVRDDGTTWPVELILQARGDTPRISVTSRLRAPRPGAVRSFHGPSLLVGDRRHGARKDFAIFPGLEFLEGEEESSSTRDLAYPLSDRRVPAAYKVTTPLLAVEDDGLLTALLWSQRQRWTHGQESVAARFVAPAVETPDRRIHMGLSVPPVGERVPENSTEAHVPVALTAGQELRIESVLLLDQRRRYPPGHIARLPRRAGLVLQALRHWFEEFGLPQPSAAPRSWAEQKELSRHAYLDVLWQDSPPGWRHCRGWSPGLLIGHCVPLLLDRRDGASASVRAEIDRRIDLILGRNIRERGKGSLWRGDGCHIILGELPFHRGHLGENLRSFASHARGRLAARRDGYWRWQPQSDKHASLGTPGTHTAGQATLPLFEALRAARMSGDRKLAREGLEALRILDEYSVPRGAQTWECPILQPDILASAYAVRCYCEAYRLSGDPAHLVQARYWAWTGLPFVYTWELPTHPTMRYNVIAVMGSTFHTHSWIGLPVVWCGLAYAYALQDLAQFDDSFPWRTIAQGITRSAMWQQYTDGPSRGCYPDSWHMVDNAPRPADINPEDILVNALRLRGMSPEITHARVPGATGSAQLNSAALTLSFRGKAGGDGLVVRVGGPAGSPFYSSLAPVADPRTVSRTDGRARLERAVDSEALQALAEGWLYDSELRGVILKTTPGDDPVEYRIRW